jgi:hypothetical protein
MLLMQENEKKNYARRSHQESKTSKPPSHEELIQQYKDSKFLSAGQVFGNGNGPLSTEVCNEVIHRNEARREKEAAVVSRKKTKLQELISSAIVVKDKMKSKTYKLNRKDLLVLVRYKHSKGDQKIPSTVADLEAWWNKTKHRASPHCSPNAPLLIAAPTILTTKKRRTLMTRRVER